jgi:type II secretory pathway pseudopilin PulG
MRTVRNTKKATSLMEVLIVLAIIAVAIVSTMNVLIKANVSIKSNEIQDLANDTVLKAIELVKSPSRLLIKASTSDFNKLTTTADPNNFYALKEDSNGTFLEYDTQFTSNNPLTTCSTSSFYYSPIRVNNVTQPYIFCMQVQFIPRTQLDNSRYYEVKVKIIYSLSGQPERVEEYKTFRYASFVSI